MNGGYSCSKVPNIPFWFFGCKCLNFQRRQRSLGLLETIQSFGWMEYVIPCLACIRKWWDMKDKYEAYFMHLHRHHNSQFTMDVHRSPQLRHMQIEQQTNFVRLSCANATCAKFKIWFTERIKQSYVVVPHNERTYGSLLLSVHFLRRASIKLDAKVAEPSRCICLTMINTIRFGWRLVRALHGVQVLLWPENDRITMLPLQWNLQSFSTATSMIFEPQKAIGYQYEYSAVNS